MHRSRRVAATAALTALTTVAAGLLGVAPADADGDTAVAATCQVPLVGASAATVHVTATDSADPVAPGATVVNTLKVPIPEIGDLPLTVTLKEVKITTPIPAGVTVLGVTGTPSDFNAPTHAVTGGNLVITITGSYTLTSGGPPPTVPDLSITTNVGSAPRTISWRVPSSIVAKADAGFLGTQTITCTPDDPNQVLVTTTVQANRAPVATSQSLATARDTPLVIALAGTDPDGDPLTYAVTGQPTHGILDGTPPTVTYTPAAGYLGPDQLTFTVSDGTATATGTVAIAVGAVPAAAPALTETRPHDGIIEVAWTAPADDGGSPVSGYRIEVLGGSDTTVDATARRAVVPAANGVAQQVRVRAITGAGDGAAATSAPVLPQPWLPFASWADAVERLHAWFLDRPPTQAERNRWIGRFQAGTHGLADLVSALRTGDRHVKVVDPVIRLYQAYFLRVPDDAGVRYWIGQRAAGTSLAKISGRFATSSEFRTRYGSLSNRAFVERVYLNVLGRPGDRPGIDYWTSRLDTKKRTRGTVMTGFSESGEYQRKQARNVEAAALLLFLEHRTPSVADRDGLAAALTDPAATREAIRALLRRPAVVTRAGFPLAVP